MNAKFWENKGVNGTEKWSEFGKESKESSIRKVKGRENSQRRALSGALCAVRKVREM